MSNLPNKDQSSQHQGETPQEKKERIAREQAEIDEWLSDPSKSGFVRRVLKRMSSNND